MNKDRVAYINSIEFCRDESKASDPNIIPAIIQYFDETMGLYDILGDNIKKINGEEQNGNIHFIIDLETKSAADVLAERLRERQHISVYGRNFTLSFFRENDCTVTIMVNQINASPF